MNKNLIEKIAPQLTELMIKKMETLTEEWRKPWIADLAHGLPRNLRGTPYRGGNILMLLFLSEIAGYSTPSFYDVQAGPKGGGSRTLLRNGPSGFVPGSSSRKLYTPPSNGRPDKEDWRLDGTYLPPRRRGRDGGRTTYDVASP